MPFPVSERFKQIPQAGQGNIVLSSTVLILRYMSIYRHISQGDEGDLFGSSTILAGKSFVREGGATGRPGIVGLVELAPPGDTGTFAKIVFKRRSRHQADEDEDEDAEDDEPNELPAAAGAALELAAEPAEK
jgi:hypothetical protein